MTFHFDARLDLSSEERELFDQYRLGPLVVYDSDAYIENADYAYSHFDDAANLPWFPTAAEIASALWSNAKGAARAAMMLLSLRVSVADLIAGQHVECEDLHAILACEEAIKLGCEILAQYLQIALTYDGREDLHEYT